MKKFFLVSLFICLLYFVLSATDFLSSGLDAYARSDWSAAVLSFQKAMESSGGKYEEAHYWLIMAKASARNFQGALYDADRFLEYFQHSLSLSDVLYQKGRVECLLGHHDASIGTLYEFISNYPTHHFIPSAYFWIGENLYMSGRLNDARTIFSRVLVDFPGSSKGEAARYKLALIDQASTQEELLRLLKMSHEESLHLAEQYRKQQKTYENKINSYQKEISNANSDNKVVELNQKLLEERQKSAELYDKLTMLQMKNDELSSTLSLLSSDVPYDFSETEPIVEVNPEVPVEEFNYTDIVGSTEPLSNQVEEDLNNIDVESLEEKKQGDILKELLEKADKLKYQYKNAKDRENQ